MHDRPASHGPALSVEGVLALLQSSCTQLERLSMRGHPQLAQDVRVIACVRDLRARGVKVDLATVAE